MNEEKNMRLSQVARRLNVGTDTIAFFLEQSGFIIDNKPNSKITPEQFDLLAIEFVSARLDKKEAAQVTIGKTYVSLVAPVSIHGVKEASVQHKAQLFAGTGVATNTGVLPTKEQVDIEGQHSAKVKRGIKMKEIRPSHYEATVPVLAGLKAVGKVELGRKKAASAVISLVDLPTVIQEVLPSEASKEVSSHSHSSSDASDSDLGQVVVPLPLASNKIALSVSEYLKKPKVVGKITLPERTSRKYQNGGPRLVQVKHNGLVVGEKGIPLPTISTQQAALKKKTNKTVYGSVISKSVKKIGSCKAVVPPCAKGKGGSVKVIDKEREGISSQEIASQIKKTLAGLNQGGGDGSRAKYKRGKRSANLEAEDKRQRQEKEAEKILKVTEFISANELASFMGITVNEVLSTCISLGMIISINQRLDAETITVVADEFGYDVEFVDVHNEEIIEDREEIAGEFIERPPIVTIMGHVDHGKTSLLDYIHTTKVTTKEAGGITQHIGAYDIMTEHNKRIVFLDTPGHEAFTAMRTRGARVTDIVVIVVAADDSVMPQTKESISHAQVAGCPIIIAINKIDKPQANSEKVKEDLANLNILVEDWGGKYQCQELSAKTGQGVNDLLDKILLEASLLELKAIPSRKATGTIIESFLDPGRGYVSTGIVQDGTLSVGDIVLVGAYYGKVKAMLNHRGIACTTAPPAMPVQVFGLNGAPRAGDTFRVMHSSMKEVGELAQKKQQLLREQTLRIKSHLTLDEIGRRLAVGNFKELNIIIKGDVDGSIEALADALFKLSNEEVQVNIVHKCVGAVSESDILLASATGAIVISFHIKPSAQAKKLAERECVVIKHYAVIYAAIDDIRNIVQGLLSPIVEEIPTGQAEVKKIFAFSKIGNIAGCQVQKGFIQQSNPIRVIRQDQVIFTGSIHTIKHGLEEIKQVKSVSECGIHIKNFDDIEVGDILEGFEQKEIKRLL